MDRHLVSDQQLPSFCQACRLASPCLVFIDSLYRGSCTIQPTSVAFSSEELLDMITRCGLNQLNQFTTFLGHHLRDSKTNPRLLQAFVQLDEVIYGGLPLGCEEETWALQNGINLRVGGVSAITSWHLLTRPSLLIPKLYRMSLRALKSVLYRCRMVGRVKMRNC